MERIYITRIWWWKDDNHKGFIPYGEEGFKLSIPLEKYRTKVKRESGKDPYFMYYTKEE